MKGIVLAAAAIVAILATSAPAAAQSGSWSITSFHADVVVSRDGAVHIIEDIDVDFDNLPSHGIFRDIPYQYTVDAEHNREIDFDDVLVTNGTTAVPFKRTDGDGYIDLKIGDPDVLLTGPQHYRIAYTMRGALNPFADHDELYLNITGDRWETSIERASATLTLPGQAITTRCFEGPTGSTVACETADNTFATSGRLFPGQGLTVLAALPKGMVPVPELNLVDAHKDPLERAADFFGLGALPAGAAFVVLAVVVAAFAVLWWRNGRDRWYGDTYYLSEDRPHEEIRPPFAHQTIVVEYTPPELENGSKRRLRPAEIGLLLDERADTLDVSATIVDLAVRKYLRIKQLDTDGVFGMFKSQDYELERIRPHDDDLLSYERKLLNALFDEGATVRLSDLTNTFHTDLQKVRQDLYDLGVRKNRFFPGDPEDTRTSYRTAGIAIAIGGGVLTWALGSRFGAGLIGVPVIIGGVAMALLSHLMPRRTAIGWETYRGCLGFRLYMVTAETDRQKFAEEANIFQEYLPYAIVYGCVDKWANAFEGLGADKQPDWYIGTQPFAPVAFANSLNGFSTSIGTAMASTPAGSGGSGFSMGGGFSGGGIGGGGGGRW